MDETFLLILNAYHAALPFTLPAHRTDIRWELILDTRTAEPPRRARPSAGGETYRVEGRSVVVFRLKVTA